MKHKGFTLIEVVLVLAIAGLIFTMVFIALPALWATEHDSERRDDMLSFIDTLKNFQQNNNRGALPTFAKPTTNSVASTSLSADGSLLTIIGEQVESKAEYTGNTWTDFYSNYFSDTYFDPDGTRYNWQIFNCTASALDTACNNSPLTTLYDGTFDTNDHTMYIVISGTCEGEEVKLSANSRKVAVLYHLESGGVYCGNS